MPTIKIMHDDMCQSPREWDNLGTMVCTHRRYSLGDLSGYKDLETEVCSHRELEYGYDLSDLIQAAEKLGFIILPLYLYDHSGITMNTTGFSCPWDSGQVGVIFVTREKVRKDYGVKRISPKLLNQVQGYLKSEVEVYDQYLRGDVYGFKLMDDDDTEIDSCWGFFGDDHKTNGMMDYWPEEYHDIEPELVWG